MLVLGDAGFVTKEQPLGFVYVNDASSHHWGLGVVLMEGTTDDDDDDNDNERDKTQ